MAVLRVQGFAGIIPVTGDRALPDNFAVDSVNSWLYGGELRGLRPPVNLQVVNTTTRKVLRIPKRTVGGDPAFPTTVPPPSYLGDSVWKQFTDRDTDILKGQLIEDQYERYYFCSPTTGPMFNTYARMRDGLTDYRLGVPGPNVTTKPPVKVTSLTSANPAVCTVAAADIGNFVAGQRVSISGATGTGTINANGTWVIGTVTATTFVLTSCNTSGGTAQVDGKIQAMGTNPDQVTIAVTGGVAPTTTRAYTYTWVNEFGEESAPALPTLFSGGNANGLWTIGNIVDPPAVVAGQPAWSKKYLYRTLSGESGQTTYYRVNTIPLGTTTYADDTALITDAILAGNLTLESTSWVPPLVDLQGWIAMPNGFLIGFKGNTVYMSEPYHWHAWPVDYKYAVETPIVGLGVIGQTCVVCTQGYPASVTGTKPATCTFTKATADEPCLSRGSIVSTPIGVIWASQNGLVLVGPNGIQNATQQLITREQWIKDYAPQWLRAARYQNGYLALRMLPTTGGTQTAFYLDPSDLKVALTELSDFDDVRNLQNDFWSGEVFVIDSAGHIDRWDPPTEELMPVKWKSKEFQYQYQENFSTYAIYWDEARFSNANYGLSVMPVTEHVRFKVYADRRLVYDQPVPKNGRPVRLPSGFKADIWQFEIRARAPVYTLHVASTARELKGV